MGRFFFSRESSNVSEEVSELKKAVIYHLRYTLLKDKHSATKRDLFHSLALAIKDKTADKWLETQQHYYDSNVKRVYYLSMEFLMGRTLMNNLINIQQDNVCAQVMKDLGCTTEFLSEMEVDAGLGNGGLGRLAACFLDSMATVGIAGYGYGIRYDYGIFKQTIENGEQVEKPDNWLYHGNPWEIKRTEFVYPVLFYGKTKHYTDSLGKNRVEWIEAQEVSAIAHDTPIPGYGNNTVNTLRLWQAHSPKGFDFRYFNHGNYMQAMEEIAMSGNISRVLYPNDSFAEGQELRLKQEYFLVSSTIQDIIRRYNKTHLNFDSFSDKIAIQINDTHPALAIAELMRLFLDREELEWDQSWSITQKVFGYTNHTILPEALERWPVDLIGSLLPRHLEIIFEINARWLNQIRTVNNVNSQEKIEAMSIIEEAHSTKMVNMARLAIVGSHKINGVSQLHSDILKNSLFKNFYEVSPDKFCNKTNGITQRRWLKVCNPELAKFIDTTIGPEWTTDLYHLKNLESHIENTDFVNKWLDIKKNNKIRLAHKINDKNNVLVDPCSIFDSQIKRFHEYKRQLLNVLQIIGDYQRIKDNPNEERVPRTVIFSGKAAPGYAMAKLIIKLINSVATVINSDKSINDNLKIIFLANYSVSTAEVIIPATDISEQISTAGTEASGTGNMKFALNGALTIGTLDGANIELSEEIGIENMFIFGLKSHDVIDLKNNGYDPKKILENNQKLKNILNLISNNYFSPTEPGVFQPIIDSLITYGDNYMLLADFDSYDKACNDSEALFKDHMAWGKKSILNSARCGKFSSDRTIREYSKDIWGV